MGGDPVSSTQRVLVTTASLVEYAALVTIPTFNALHQLRSSFQAIAHSLPPSSSVDGLLGLDFFWNSVLTIDFHEGSIEQRH